jgi:hypothetical protein
MFEKTLNIFLQLQVVHMYFRHLKCVCRLFVQSVGRFGSFIVRCLTFHHLNFYLAYIVDNTFL